MHHLAPHHQVPPRTARRTVTIIITTHVSSNGSTGFRVYHDLDDDAHHPTETVASFRKSPKTPSSTPKKQQPPFSTIDRVSPSRSSHTFISWSHPGHTFSPIFTSSIGTTLCHVEDNYFDSTGIRRFSGRMFHTCVHSEPGNLKEQPAHFDFDSNFNFHSAP